MLEMKAYITNLGKYNEGRLVGEWLDFPHTEQEKNKLLNEIGISKEYEEFFITDYECNLEGVRIGEYENIEELNELAEKIFLLNQDDFKKLNAMLSVGYFEDLEDCMDNLQNCYLIDDVVTKYDVGYYYLVDEGCLEEIPSYLKDYINYEAYGRDILFDGCHFLTDSGLLIIS